MIFSILKNEKRGEKAGGMETKGVGVSVMETEVGLFGKIDRDKRIFIGICNSSGNMGGG